MPLAQYGLYFLANDAIYDWAKAFLNSVRLYNPTLPLCLIPFDSHICRLRLERNKYGFDVFEDDDLLSYCDDIGRQLHGRPVGHYRKLVTWFGAFDTFIYIDCDTVVLRKLEGIYDVVQDYGFLTSHSNMPTISQWTWKTSAFSCLDLDSRGVRFAANTGFIASHKGILSTDTVTASVKSGITCRDHMNLSSMEQPFLNYLFTTSGHAYSSLSVLSYVASARGAWYTLATEFWAGMPGGRVEEGQMYRTHSAVPVLLVHWAGNFKPNVGGRPTEGMHWVDGRVLRTPGHRDTFPYQHLWEYYRYLDAL